MVLQRGKRARPVRELALRFFDYAQRGEFDAIWDEMMTVEAQNLISTAYLPLTLFREAKVDQLLDLEHVEGLALAFQMNHENMRTGFFAGIVSSLSQMGWYEFTIESLDAGYVFVDGDAAVLIADRHPKPLLLFFTRDENRELVIDWEALAVFSMTLSSQRLFELGTTALVRGKPQTAEQFFNLSRDLLPTYKRLKRLVWSHPVVGQLVTPERKAELEAERQHAARARAEADAVRTGGRPLAEPLDMQAFLIANFGRYSDLTRFPLDESDIQVLEEMSDERLRTKIASILIKADPAVAMREARKPHGPAELADIVVEVPFNEKIYTLCLPFKSGREYRSRSSVPSSMAYQVWRPHMFLTRAVFVLITAKPCSQNLLNDIRQSRDRLGWPIETIEGPSLGSLLKANDLL